MDIREAVEVKTGKVICTVCGDNGIPDFVCLYVKKSGFLYKVEYDGRYEEWNIRAISENAPELSDEEIKYAKNLALNHLLQAIQTDNEC